jgi:hypothetical protein
VQDRGVFLEFLRLAAAGPIFDRAQTMNIKRPEDIKTLAEYGVSDAGRTLPVPERIIITSNAAYYELEELIR